jgi:hypothetical protein
MRKKNNKKIKNKNKKLLKLKKKNKKESKWKKTDLLWFPKNRKFLLKKLNKYNK